MTREEKEEQGKKRAEKDFAKLAESFVKRYDSYRIVGRPYGGKYASERKISLLENKKKIGEICCGYSSFEDEAYFSEMEKLVEKNKKST